MTTQLHSPVVFYFEEPADATYQHLARLFIDYPAAIGQSYQLPGYQTVQEMKALVYDACDVTLSRRIRVDGTVHFGANITSEDTIEWSDVTGLLTTLTPVPPSNQPYGYLVNGEVSVIVTTRFAENDLSTWLPYVRAGASVPDVMQSSEDFTAAFWQLVSDGVLVPLIDEIRQAGPGSLMYVRDGDFANYLLWQCVGGEGPLGDVGAFTNITSIDKPGAVRNIGQLRQLMKNNPNVTDLVGVVF